MGQVWSSADFDGITEAGYEGGRGSVLAVTAQNPGPDGIWDTADDLLTPINQRPVWASIDNAPGLDDRDPLDRVRGFHGLHGSGAVFAFADVSTTFIRDSIDPMLFRHLSTVNGREFVEEF